MRIWKWEITLERVEGPRSRPAPVATTDELRSFLLGFPPRSIVKNLRTGENVGIGIWGIDDQIDRGIGSVAAQECRPDDHWVVIDTVIPHAG